MSTSSARAETTANSLSPLLLIPVLVAAGGGALLGGEQGLLAAALTAALAGAVVAVLRAPLGPLGLVVLLHVPLGVAHAVTFLSGDFTGTWTQITEAARPAMKQLAFWIDPPVSGTVLMTQAYLAASALIMHGAALVIGLACLAIAPETRRYVMPRYFRSGTDTPIAGILFGTLIAWPTMLYVTMTLAFHKIATWKVHVVAAFESTEPSRMLGINGMIILGVALTYITVAGLMSRVPQDE